MKIGQEGRKLHGIFTWKRTRTGGHLSRSFNQLSDYVVVTTGTSAQRLFGGQADAEESQPLTKSANSLKRLTFPSGSIQFLNLENGIIPDDANGGVRAIGAIMVENHFNAAPATFEGNFTWVQTKLDAEIASGARIIIKRSDNLNPRFFRDPVGYKPFPSMADQGFSVGTNEDGSQLINDLFGPEGDRVSYPKPLELCRKLIATKGFFDGNLTVLDYFAGSGTTAHAVLSLNRDDDQSRRYMLVEQGPYFDTVIKPRIQKVVFSADWRDGKPTAPETGISHAFKVLKIESYEDTLNNLNLQRDDAQTGLLDAITPAARDDYLMRYMLDVEARGSILSVEDFRKPFDYTLNIAVDSAGAYTPTKVDLVETFNYLIGLIVRHIDIQLQRGFVTVEGTLPTGERTLVLWRDCDMLDYEGLAKLCDKLAINPADSEYAVVYINGDHNIPSVLQSSDADGGSEKKLKLKQIEPAFLEAMFDTGNA
ncbi:MAG: DNA methyltransferase [bacterium]|nr:DNA methyltransferase [bacterium]